MMFWNKAFWLGAIGSAAFLAVFVLLFVDFDTIGDVLSEANYLYVAPSLFLYFLAVWFRSERWKLLLRPLIGTPKKSNRKIEIWSMPLPKNDKPIDLANTLKEASV